MNNDDREVTFEIVEEIGVISTSGTGWQKELNIVAWNGNQGKYDIREWSPHHDRMSRGITLNEQEMRSIVDLLKRRVRYVPRGRVTISQDSAPEPQGGDEFDAAAEDAPTVPMQSGPLTQSEPPMQSEPLTQPELPTQPASLAEPKPPMQADEGGAAQAAAPPFPRAAEEDPQQDAAF
ncbi:MAG: hypothetical protein IJ109_03280 [Firmicutes bacterium]|nr:hypothetical protein [Bacillota bacterium]